MSDPTARLLLTCGDDDVVANWPAKHAGRTTVHGHLVRPLVCDNAFDRAIAHAHPQMTEGVFAALFTEDRPQKRAREQRRTGNRILAMMKVARGFEGPSYRAPSLGEELERDLVFLCAEKSENALRDAFTKDAPHERDFARVCAELRGAPDMKRRWTVIDPMAVLRLSALPLDALTRWRELGTVTRAEVTHTEVTGAETVERCARDATDAAMLEFIASRLDKLSSPGGSREERLSDPRLRAELAELLRLVDAFERSV